MTWADIVHVPLTLWQWKMTSRPWLWRWASQPDDSQQPVTHEETNKLFKSQSFAKDTGHLLLVLCQDQSKFIFCFSTGHWSCHIPTSVSHYTSTRLCTTNLRNVLTFRLKMHDLRASNIVNTLLLTNHPKSSMAYEAQKRRRDAPHLLQYCKPATSIRSLWFSPLYKSMWQWKLLGVFPIRILCTDPCQRVWQNINLRIFFKLYGTLYIYIWDWFGSSRDTEYTPHVPNSYILVYLLLDGLHFGTSKSIHKCLAIVGIAVAWCCHSLNIAQFLHIKHGFAHLGDWDCTRAAGHLGGLLELFHPIHFTGRRRWWWLLWWRRWWRRHAEIVFS